MADVLFPGQKVPVDLASAQVMDSHGTPHRFDSLWSDVPALILFIRHFGCIACSEQLTVLLPRLAEFQRLGLSVSLVGNGHPHFIPGFIKRNGLKDKKIRILTDVSLRVFKEAGLIRSAWAVAGPRAFRDLLRALGSGHFQTSIEGDALQQGGALLLDESGTVRFYHRAESLGDHADPSVLMEAAMSLAVSKRPDKIFI